MEYLISFSMHMKSHVFYETSATDFLKMIRITTKKHHVPLWIFVIHIIRTIYENYWKLVRIELDRITRITIYSSFYTPWWKTQKRESTDIWVEATKNIAINKR